MTSVVIIHRVGPAEVRCHRRVPRLVPGERQAAKRSATKSACFPDPEHAAVRLTEPPSMSHTTPGGKAVVCRSDLRVTALGKCA